MDELLYRVEHLPAGDKAGAGQADVGAETSLVEDPGGGAVHEEPGVEHSGQVVVLDGPGHGADGRWAAPARPAGPAGGRGQEEVECPALLPVSLFVRLLSRKCTGDEHRG